jgi:nucleoside-diphosphate-sugar epimerase
MILITGATGFIGSKLVEKLSQGGHAIHAFCRSSSDTSVIHKNNVKIFVGDLLDTNSIESAMAHCEYVYHLAALAKNWSTDSEDFMNVNLVGTKNIFETALKLKIKKVVFTSTSLTFGPSNDAPMDENHARPHTVFTDYGRSKRIAETIIPAYISRGLNISIVNPTRLFGPGLLSEGNSVTIMINLYLQGKWRFVLGDGRAIGNYAYIDDVVQGHILAMKRGQPGQFYILGGEDLTYNHLFQRVANTSGRSYRLLHLPCPLARLFARSEMYLAKCVRHHPLITPEWIELFIQDWAFSSKKAQSEIGYTITPVKKAIKQTVSWLEKN